MFHFPPTRRTMATVPESVAVYCVHGTGEYGTQRSIVDVALTWIHLVSTTAAQSNSLGPLHKEASVIACTSIKHLSLPVPFRPPPCRLLSHSPVNQQQTPFLVAPPPTTPSPRFLITPTPKAGQDILVSVRRICNRNTKMYVATVVAKTNNIGALLQYILTTLCMARLPPIEIWSNHLPKVTRTAQIRAHKDPGRLCRIYLQSSVGH
jgi:hypothetical protein